MNRRRADLIDLQKQREVVIYIGMNSAATAVFAHAGMCVCVYSQGWALWSVCGAVWAGTRGPGRQEERRTASAAE